MTIIQMLVLLQMLAIVMLAIWWSGKTLSPSDKLGPGSLKSCGWCQELRNDCDESGYCPRCPPY